MDLLVLRSDAYELSEDLNPRSDTYKLKCLKLVTPDKREVEDKAKPPRVKLDKCYTTAESEQNYAAYDKLEDLIAKVNVPSLINCESMEIIGPQVEFAKGVVIKGNVTFVNNRTNPVEDKKVEDNKNGSSKPDNTTEKKQEEKPVFSKQIIPAGVYNGGKGKTYEAGGKD